MSVNTAHLISQQANYNTAPPIPSVSTEGWYTTQFGCLRTDPTVISRRHTFPDAPIPIGIPTNPAAPARMTDVSRMVPESGLYASWSSTGIGCSQYSTAWPMNTADTAGMVDVEREHPQFAFRAGAPGTVYQIDVESQLRRLDQPAGKCTQGVIPMDAPLFQNTVAPPPSVGIPEGVQNACNPVAAMIRGTGQDSCRAAADSVALQLSGRWVNNPTRMDTLRFALPFAPPGIGTPVRA